MSEIKRLQQENEELQRLLERAYGALQRVEDAYYADAPDGLLKVSQDIYDFLAPDK